MLIDQSGSIGIKHKANCVFVDTLCAHQIYILKLIFCMLVLFSGTNLHGFHEQDLKRVRDDDVWLSRFLKSRKQDVNNALLALVFTCVIYPDKFVPEFNFVFPPANCYYLYTVRPRDGRGETRVGGVTG